jgi:hypothetical protein
VKTIKLIATIGLTFAISAENMGSERSILVFFISLPISTLMVSIISSLKSCRNLVFKDEKISETRQRHYQYNGINAIFRKL